MTSYTRRIPIIVIYDGECSFCKRLVRWMRAYTQVPVVFTAYQSLGQTVSIKNIPSIEALKSAVHVQDSDGQWFSAAHAVLLLLAHSSIPFARIFLSLYKRSNPFRRFSEATYASIANRRSCAIKSCTL